MSLLESERKRENLDACMNNSQFLASGNFQVEKLTNFTKAFLASFINDVYKHFFNRILN